MFWSTLRTPGFWKTVQTASPRWNRDAASVDSKKEFAEGGNAESPSIEGAMLTTNQDEGQGRDAVNFTAVFPGPTLG